MKRRGPAERVLQPRIVRVLEVVDTREYEEGPDGKFHAIPDSGNPRDCDRCSRVHRVHASVLLEDETTAVVGTGCMTQSEMDISKRVKSAERIAKRIRQLEAELGKKQSRYQRWQADRAAVEALPLPPMSEEIITNYAGEVPILRMGDAHVWMRLVRSPGDRKEREQALIFDWQNKRMKERGWGLVSENMASEIRAIEKSLDRALATLATTLED